MESWREGQDREYTRDRPEGWLNLPHRYSPQDRDANGRSLLYRDLEDVWVINREYSRGEKKNGNKLPDELIRKILLYSSNPGDTVCDFFMGNFTTARVALELGRIPVGFELNPNACDYHIPRIRDLLRKKAA